MFISFSYIFSYPPPQQNWGGVLLLYKMNLQLLKILLINPLIILLFNLCQLWCPPPLNNKGVFILFKNILYSIRFGNSTMLPPPKEGIFLFSDIKISFNPLRRRGGVYSFIFFFFFFITPNKVGGVFWNIIIYSYKYYTSK